MRQDDEHGALILQLAEALNPETSFIIVTDDQLESLGHVCSNPQEGDLLVYFGESREEVAVRVREISSRSGEVVLVVSYADPERPGCRVVHEVASPDRGKEIIKEVLLKIAYC